MATQPDENWRRFGLGNLALPESAVPKILTQLNWDGESVPYLSLVKFFEDAVQDALARVDLVDPDPQIVELIETGSWRKSGVPEKVLT
jgi:hypothetical protein